MKFKKNENKSKISDILKKINHNTFFININKLFYIGNTSTYWINSTRINLFFNL